VLLQKSQITRRMFHQQPQQQSRALPDQMVNVALLVQWVQQDLKVLKVRKVLKDLKALQVLLVLLALKVIKE
jgi:hypothetical protein